MVDDSYKGKIYVGTVEDINDPKRLGRIKVRVQSVFERIPLEHIPGPVSSRAVQSESE